MFEDGYVLDIEIAVCVSETGPSYGNVLFSQLSKDSLTKKKEKKKNILCSVVNSHR